MSDKKTYTASEVARMILEKTHQTLRKHEELLKSKNSAHEIDLGEEPNNDEAECPESLKASGSSSSGEKSEKKPKAEASESSEDPAMEDEPLSDFENEAEEEAEEEVEEEYEEEQEPKKFFKKSESGMFTVQYMRLAKDDTEGGEETVDFGDMEKARVDEGKSINEKQETRRNRNNRDEKEDKRRDRNGKFYSNSRETIGVHIPVNKDSGKNANYDWHGSKKAVDKIKTRSSINTKYRDLPPNLPKSEGMMKEEEKPKDSQRISFKRFEEGDKKMTREQHAESKRTAQNPGNTKKEFQDPRKKMGQWRQRKHKETGNLDYLKGNKDHEYKEE